MTRAALGRSLLLALGAYGPLALYAAGQDAKGFWEKAKTEGDQCTKMHYLCEAARLDPKEKQYSDSCNKFRAGLEQSDIDSVKSAKLALAENNLKKAGVYAGSGYVCKYDEPQWAQAQQIIQEIKVAQNPTPAQPTAPAPVAKIDNSAAMLDQARKQFKAGDFSAAKTSVSQVTDPHLEPIAAEISQKIDSYTAAIHDAQQKEAAKDYPGAIRSYQAAADEVPGGPGDPAAQIARLRPMTAQVVQPPAPIQPMTPAPKPPPSPVPGPGPGLPKPKPEDTAAKIAAQVASLLAEAKQAQDSGNLAEAGKAFNGVLRLQPDNQQAKAGLAGVEDATNRNPVLREAKLATAIREFYSSDFDNARDDLDEYLRSADAASKGAAFFYRGATILSKRILEKVEDKANAASLVQENFKLARAANYRPRKEFVSPVILSAWEVGAR